MGRGPKSHHDNMCAQKKTGRSNGCRCLPKNKNCTQRGEVFHKKKERIAIHKIARVKRKWIFPGLNVLTGGYSKKKGGGFHKKKSKISYTQK